LVLKFSGKICIGDDVYFGSNSKIWSASNIYVGNRVFISYGVNIHDNDAHSVSAKNRQEQFKEIFIEGHIAPLNDVNMGDVFISDDVWIGFNASILKGVHIGEGAIIASSSVVTRSVDPFTIVAGNPAKKIGMSSK
jgi:maltose O-acetyltransferase